MGVLTQLQSFAAEGEEGGNKKKDAAASLLAKMKSRSAPTRIAPGPPAADPPGTPAATPALSESGAGTGLPRLMHLPAADDAPLARAPVASAPAVAPAVSFADEMRALTNAAAAEGEAEGEARAPASPKIKAL